MKIQINHLHNLIGNPENWRFPLWISTADSQSAAKTNNFLASQALVHNVQHRPLHALPLHS
ncbi:hypothetical protein ACPOL_2293 [Acidisarcina polymorpha]|uniref:Uncharacterized protein n=1 Tax=Acidisarcina polymorpha TaxID=2211140 RepID=A0A2Z5FYS4_9BACT|nr:hypothetical protein ACPOL_2293 [Acidisarcina polymorpha]